MKHKCKIWLWEWEPFSLSLSLVCYFVSPRNEWRLRFLHFTQLLSFRQKKNSHSHHRWLTYFSDYCSLEFEIQILIVLKTTYHIILLYDHIRNDKCSMFTLHESLYWTFSLSRATKFYPRYHKLKFTTETLFFWA